MEGLIKKIEDFHAKEKELFNRIFGLEIQEATLHLPQSLKEKFGQEAEHQKIFLLQNKITGEQSSYNQWRARRPKPRQEESPHQNAYDPFIDPESLTPEDQFGRIENEFGTTAANLAKIQSLHSLIAFKKKNEADLMPEDIAGCLQIANQWFEKATEKNGQESNGILFWNMGYRAAASILHPHFQLLFPANAHGRTLHLQQSAALYEKQHGTPYWDDFIAIHKTLGLAKEKDAVITVIPLVQYKDYEILFFADSISGNEKELGVLLERYKNLNHNFSFFSYYKKPSNLPLAFALSRGFSNQKSSEIGALEIYHSSIVEEDPISFSKKFF